MELFTVDDSKHTESFKQKMHAMVVCMTYMPTEATWHEINHYVPCIGIPSYSYKPHESLDLCDRITSILETFDQMLRDDLFLTGRYKTRGPKLRSERAPMKSTHTTTILSVFGSETESGDEKSLSIEEYSDRSESDEEETEYVQEEYDDVSSVLETRDSVFTTTPLIE